MFWDWKCLGLELKGLEEHIRIRGNVERFLCQHQPGSLLKVLLNILGDGGLLHLSTLTGVAKPFATWCVEDVVAPLPLLQSTWPRGDSHLWSFTF